MEFRRKYFDPLGAADARSHASGVVSLGTGLRAGDVYVYTPTTVLALNVALAANRPLLITGEPGSGKTTLAQNAARVLDWWFYRETVTSRLQASDLFYTFDALGRLNDASTPGVPLKPTWLYVQPGVLWWAFDPASASHRGQDTPVDSAHRAVNRGVPGRSGRPDAVVLLDEIDKADPDVPNDLLEAFESRRFDVKETGTTIEAAADRRLLLMLTTNGERELPPAFLRRCVTLALEPPTAAFFATVADERYGKESAGLHLAIANEVMEARKDAKARAVRMPSTAEFLDAVQVCLELGVSASSEAWKAITGSVLLKSDKA